MSVVRLRQISQFICVSLFTVCIYLYHHICSIRGACDKYEIWLGVDQIKCQSRDSVRSSNLYLAIVTTSVPSDQNCNTRETRETREVPVLSTLDSQDNIKEGQSKQDNIKEGQSKQYNQDNLKEGQSIKLQDNVSQYHLVPWIPSVDTKEHLFVG